MTTLAPNVLPQNRSNSTLIHTTSFSQTFSFHQLQEMKNTKGIVMNTTKKPPRKNIYNKITDQILDDLKQGTRPWFKPWRNSPENLAISKPLRANGTPYKGVNILMLWSAAADHCYHSPTWMPRASAQFPERYNATARLFLLVRSFNSSPLNCSPISMLF